MARRKGATWDLIVVADVDGVAAPAAVRVGGLQDGAVGAEEGVVVGARVEALVACGKWSCIAVSSITNACWPREKAKSDFILDAMKSSRPLLCATPAGIVLCVV